MTAGSCRWHEDAGRCGNPVAFPGVAEVPEMCTYHIHSLEPWIRSRVAARRVDGAEWGAWGARRAAQAEQELKAIGAIQPSRAVDDGRPVRPAGPQRT